MLSLEKILKNCPEIPTNTQYWFVRTEGGSLYPAFTKSGCIALGYPEVSVSYIDALADDEKGRETLKNKIKKEYPDTVRAGLAASQLMKFCKNMKKGDFVLVPSAFTKRISIGTIVDTKAYEKVLVDGKDTFHNFTKCRKVKWLKTVGRFQLNPNLFRMFNTHQTIVSANDYSQWIDSTVYEFFKKGEYYHHLLDINRQSGINARQLFETCLNLFDVVGEYSKQHHFGEDFSDVDTRINLNSPGNVELITKAAKSLLFLSIAVIALNGGGLTFTCDEPKIDFDLSTDGLIQNVNSFLNDHSRRQVVGELREKIESLSIQDSEQIVKILESSKLEQKTK